MSSERNPVNTRNRILQAAFREIHQSGFQGLRVEHVLQATGLQKGAFYHHFPSKLELGYAVLDELVQQYIVELWLEPLQKTSDPVADIGALFANLKYLWYKNTPFLGCPLNNLAQEMSPLDEGFRQRTGHLFNLWQTALSEAMQRGQAQGNVLPGINTDDCALFIISTVEGAVTLCRNQQNPALLDRCAVQLQRYLNTLKAPPT